MRTGGRRQGADDDELRRLVTGRPVTNFDAAQHTQIRLEASEEYMIISKIQSGMFYLCLRCALAFPSSCVRL